jgi:hypothetical protein
MVFRERWLAIERRRGVPSRKVDVIELTARLVGCALLLSACSGDHSSPTQPPPAPPDTTTAWIGRSSVTAVTGPGACVAAEQDRYGAMERRFVIDRSGSYITLRTHHGPDVSYVGTVRGNEFSAESPGGETRWTSACGMVTSYYGGIEGRFSEDGRTLAATEFWASRLESGGEVRWDLELKLAR